ncbi:hypothetical protein FHX74_003150 [Friedmanniella endophytica]|uniref:DUF3349 domain-containing protein n=1 Tax=Microlunatus kandeliicorticis TaxID=1759536 RepID=A0A7W3IUI4_9ACTN|nr:DUF3349 domain-containing protein [Microlunatus kandeliicorticis]MBA8795514.1 hypothetical protein [Microlunatus kandeliicorticis]
MPSAFNRILQWLRAGYPEGVPDADYIPLLAVLARRLSSEEVQQVVGEICRQRTTPAENADIGVLITKITDEMPRDEDVRRVRARLAGAGWPLADPV